MKEDKSNSSPITPRTNDLSQDLRTRGCPVCDHLGRTIFDFFCSWLSPFAKDERVQNDFAVEMGFCPLHTWNLASMASIQGLAQGYPGLLERLSYELTRLTKTLTNVPENIKALIKDSTTCRVCSLLRDTEVAYIFRLALFLEQAEGRQKYAGSQGVCLKHLGLLIATLSSKETVQFFLSEAARHFNEIAQDLRNYDSKREALQRSLITRDEGDAYLRALIHIAGAKEVVDP
jgi:hypothetical protein